MGTNSSKTSLRSLEQQYRNAGYDVVYVDYNWITSNSNGMDVDEVIQQEIDGAVGRGQQVEVVGHSLGGLHVSQVSKNNTGNSNVKFFTVNSPFAVNSDNAQDFKSSDDWLNLLGLFYQIGDNIYHGVDIINDATEASTFIGKVGEHWSGHDINETFFSWLQGDEDE